MGFQEMFIVLAKDKEIQGRTRSVLDYLFSSLNFENYICLEQKKIAEELSMLQPNVSRSIKLLVKKGIILEGPKLGKMCSYKLDSHIAWKGTKTSRKNVMLT